MTTKIFDFTEKSELVFDDAEILVDNSFKCSLLATDQSANPLNRRLGGKFRNAREIIFPNFKASALEGFFSIELNAFFETEKDRSLATIGDNLGKVDFRFSPDDGANWYYAVGANFVVATDPVNHWSDEDGINTAIENFFTFPAIDRQIRITMRISPDDEFRSTPVVESICLNYDSKHDFAIDVVESLMQFMFDNARPCLLVGFFAENTDNPVILETEFQVDSVRKAYNLTVDPNRMIDIFSSLNKVNIGEDKNGETLFRNEVTLANAPALGDEIEIQYIGIAQVFTTNSDEDETNSVLPSFEIEMSISENTDYRDWSVHVEKNVVKKIARLQEQPIQYDASVIISCMAAFEPDALAMAQDLHREFDTFEKRVLSLATGKNFDAVEMLTPVANSNIVTSGLSNKGFSMTLSGEYQLSKPKTVPLLETVNIDACQLNE